MKKELLKTLDKKVNKEYLLETYYCTIENTYNQSRIKEKGKSKPLITSRGVSKKTMLNYFLCCDILELNGIKANNLNCSDNFENALLQFDINEYKFEVTKINDKKTILKIVKA